MEFPPSNTTVGLVLGAVVFFFFILPRFRRATISDLQGPSSNKWLVGNLPDLFRQMSVGDTEFKWMREYGDAVRIKTAFGRDVLFAADPKAVQHVLNISGYNYPKSPEFRALINRVNGHGLSWAEGTQHMKQRKIMNPAFTINWLKVFLPLFQQTVQRTVSKWRDVFEKEGKPSLVLDIHLWLARTTLDSIGATAFDYDFGAIDETKDNELSSVYNNLFADSFFEPPDPMLAMGELPGLVPAWVITLMDKLPDPGLIRLRHYMKIAKGVAKQLVDRQLASHAAGLEGGKDVMSILVRANLSEDPKSALTEDEMLSQMTTIMLAGHETTASTVTFALYELAKHIDIQTELREEIKAARAEAERRGDSEFSIANLESMKLLNAVIKETLRVHPILSRLERMAKHDDVIPLTTPIKTKSGKTISSIPVKAGQRVFVSVAGYNRAQSQWGKDSHTWRPKRFLEGIEKKQTTNVGVIGNVATFSGGVRSCIGWRFGMLEMQALLVELVENFEYSPPPGNVEIRRAAVSLMFPLVKGSNRTELPLTVRPIA